MIEIKVILSDGNSFITKINATPEEAKKLYIGHYFNMGTFDDDMTKAVAVEIIKTEV